MSVEELGLGGGPGSQSKSTELRPNECKDQSVSRRPKII